MCGGDPMLDLSSYTKAELFPACAGVILAVQLRITEATSFPRIRGGDPEFFRDENVDNAFSPHVRG